MYEFEYNQSDAEYKFILRASRKMNGKSAVNLIPQGRTVFPAVRIARPAAQPCPAHAAWRAPAASFFVDPEHLYCTRLDDKRVRFTCYGEFVPLGRRTPPTKALEVRLKSLIAHALPDAADWCDYNVCDV